MTRTRDAASFLLMALVFGGAFPAIEVGLRYIPPLLLAASRYGVSAALLLGYALATNLRVRPDSRGDWTAVFAGGVFFIGGTSLTFVGQQYTTAGIAAVVFSLVPILTVAVSRVLLPGERLSRRGLLGLVVGFVGVAIVSQPDPAGFVAGASGASVGASGTSVAGIPGAETLAASTLGAATLGPALVFLAALSSTFGTVLVRRSEPSLPVVALTGWAMAIGATLQAGFSAALGESLASVHVTLGALLAICYLAVFASGIGFVVYFGLLSRVGALEVNLVTYLVPVISVGIGWAFLDEPIYASTLVGFGVIVVGFLLLKNRELAAELARYRGAAR